MNTTPTTPTDSDQIPDDHWSMSFFVNAARLQGHNDDSIRDAVRILPPASDLGLFDQFLELCAFLDEYRNTIFVGQMEEWACDNEGLDPEDQAPQPVFDPTAAGLRWIGLQCRLWKRAVELAITAAGLGFSPDTYSARALGEWFDMHHQTVLRIQKDPANVEALAANLEIRNSETLANPALLRQAIDLASRSGELSSTEKELLRLLREKRAEPDKA